jgi:hypothetical protein
MVDNLLKKTGYCACKTILIGFFLSCFVFFVFTALQAATSSLDNVPGGAGIAFWQAGGGWDTLINIQETSSTCAMLHIGIYDRDGLRLNSFSLSLQPMDNVGMLVQGDGTFIYVYDYSDNAYGGSPALNDFSVAPVIHSAPSDPDGIQRGYITVVRTNIACAGPGGSPSGNITGTDFIVPDSIFIRTAFLNVHGAFACNGIMLQGFANFGTLRESSDFVDSTAIPNTPPDPCDFNGDGVSSGTFSILDDVVGADIDFAELFLSDNITGPPPWVICNGGGTVYQALGSASFIGRFNENPSVGTHTTLVLVAPQSFHPSAARFQRIISLNSYNDDGGIASSGSRTFPVVAALSFGSGGISSGAARAGEIRVTTSVPIFGFTFTETASFADIYPLIRTNTNITTLNKDLIDDAVDVISLP